MNKYLSLFPHPFAEKGFLSPAGDIEHVLPICDLAHSASFPLIVALGNLIPTHWMHLNWAGLGQGVETSGPVVEWVQDQTQPCLCLELES